MDTSVRLYFVLKCAVFFFFAQKTQALTLQLSSVVVVALRISASLTVVESTGELSVLCEYLTSLWWRSWRFSIIQLSQRRCLLVRGERNRASATFGRIVACHERE